MLVFKYKTLTLDTIGAISNQTVAHSNVAALESSNLISKSSEKSLESSNAMTISSKLMTKSNNVMAKLN